MTRLLICALLVTTAAVPSALQQATPPARPGTTQPAGPQAPGPPEAGSARVAGVVTRADNGAPLAGARVMLSGNLLRQAITDDRGRYAFGELPAGRYSLHASRPGYVTLNYGQRRAFDPGRPLALADGQELTETDFALPWGSVVTGRITDDLGEPVAGAEVRIEKSQYGPGGRQLATFFMGMTLGPFQMMTDDRGEYRIFGLQPGEYVVSARIRQALSASATPAPDGARDEAQGFVPTYYPGTADASEAQALNVGLAQEVTANFAVVPGRMIRISGTVTSSTGRPAAALTVRLGVETATSSGPVAGTVVAPDGSFHLANVAPGDYRLRVQALPGGPGAEVASLRLNVGTDDITGLHLTTTPGTRITGRLEWEGASPRPERTLRVDTTSAEWPRTGPTGEFTFTYLDTERGTVRDDQTFELDGTVGRVIFRVLPPPLPWVVKSVFADGNDITDSGADAAALGGDTRVRIVLTDRVSGLAGMARGADERQALDYVAVVLPDQEMPGGTGIRYTRAIRSDTDGRFALSPLPPGRYVGAAVDALEQGGEWSPDLQRRVRLEGTPFTIGEGQTVNVELRVLP